MTNGQTVPPGSPEEMAAANEANWLSVWRLFASAPLPGVLAHDGADSVWFLTGLPFPLMNAILRATLPVQGRDDHIEALLAPFRARQVPMLWYIWPSPSSAGVEAALLAHGLRPAGTMPAMAIDLAALPADAPLPQGVTLETISAPAALPEYVDALIACFEMPEDLRPWWLQLFTLVGVEAQAPLRHYLARLNGEPVGTTMLAMAAGAAGIYNVATRASARGRGIGSALTRQALRDARNEGYQVGVLQSSSMGHSIYETMGFRDSCIVGQFAWTPQVAQSREATAGAVPPIRQGFLARAANWWRRKPTSAPR